MRVVGIDWSPRRTRSFAPIEVKRGIFAAALKIAETIAAHPH